MGKKMQGILMTLLALMLTFTISSTSVYAAEISTGEIRVSVNLRGDYPSNEEYVIKMQADNPSNPMPEGSENDIYTLTLKGETGGKLPGMTFSTVGDYHYTIWQEKGTNTKCTYDTSVYHLFICVLNAETGDGFEVISVLTEEGKTDKLNEIQFENRYPNKPVPPNEQEESEGPEIYPAPSVPVKTGDSSDFLSNMVIAFSAIIGIALISIYKRKTNSKI